MRCKFGWRGEYEQVIRVGTKSKCNDVRRADFADGEEMPRLVRISQLVEEGQLGTELAASGLRVEASQEQAARM